MSKIPKGRICLETNAQEFSMHKTSLPRYREDPLELAIQGNFD